MDVRLSDVCTCGHGFEWHYRCDELLWPNRIQHPPEFGAPCRMNVAKYVFCPCISFNIDNLIYLERRAYVD